MAPHNKPDGGAGVGLDAPPIREPADEEEAEAARLVERADPRRGREALAVVADLDADLVVPGRVQLHRLTAVAVADRVRDHFGHEQPQALDLTVAELRGDRVAEPRPRLGDRAGL